MVLVLSATASVAWAQQPAGPAVSKIDKGDTAWMLTSSALVLLMTAPGLALFYGGMVRQKNALATLMQSFIILAVISIQWVLWVWGDGGWLKKLGALDFAGGTVVHISSGMSALVCAVLIGRRKGYGHHPMQPHNLPMTVMGASLLWFGWFGFNAGSALEANGLA